MKRTITKAVIAAFFIGLIASAGCASKKPAQSSFDPAPESIQAERDKRPKLKIAVMDFEDKTAYGRGRLGEATTDMMIVNLTKSGAFILAERAKLKTVMNEQALSAKGAVTGQEALELGRLTGANMLVFGSVVEFGVVTEGDYHLVGKTKTQKARVVVSLRVVSAQTGEVLFADQGIGKAINESTVTLGFGKQAGYDETLAGKALTAATGKLVENLINHLSDISPMVRSDQMNNHDGS